MADPLIKARGYFWWGDEVIPEGCFAPPSSITGELNISDSGQIRLRLDSTLGLPGERLGSRGPTRRPICGILSGANQYVRLMDVSAAGASINTAGPSTEAFSALYCLVSSAPFAPSEPKFKCLEIYLEGYEDWLRQYSIEVIGNARASTARFRKPKQLLWQLNIGRLSLATSLLGRMRGRHSSVTFTEASHLEFTAAEPMSEAFNTLPFGLDKKEMDSFTKRCAQRRNDLSHVGGMREPGTYREFLDDIIKLSRALDFLYHAKLLQLVGLPEDELRWAFTDSFQSYAIQKTLEVVGLTLVRPKDIAKTTGITPAPAPAV